MNKVTRKKLWRGFMLFSFVCNILGAILSIAMGQWFIAVGHLAATTVMTTMYLNELEEKEGFYEEQ